MARKANWNLLTPQALRVMNLLENSARPVTAARARDYNIANLRARISEIRDAGFNVKSVRKENRPGVKYVLG